MLRRISGIASSVLAIHVVLCSQHLTLRNPLSGHISLKKLVLCSLPHTHWHWYSVATTQIYRYYACPHNTNCVMTPYSVVGNLVSLFTALRHTLLRLGTVFIHHSRLWFFLIFPPQRTVPISRHSQLGSLLPQRWRLRVSPKLCRPFTSTHRVMI